MAANSSITPTFLRAFVRQPANSQAEQRLLLEQLVRTLLHSRGEYLRFLAAAGAREGTIAQWSVLCADLALDPGQGLHLLPVRMSHLEGEDKDYWSVEVKRNDRLVVGW
jgi:hypothetical protein